MSEALLALDESALLRRATAGYTRLIIRRGRGFLTLDLRIRFPCKHPRRLSSFVYEVHILSSRYAGGPSLPNFQ